MYRAPLRKKNRKKINLTSIDIADKKDLDSLLVASQTWMKHTSSRKHSQQSSSMATQNTQASNDMNPSWKRAVEALAVMQNKASKRKKRNRQKQQAPKIGPNQSGSNHISNAMMSQSPRLSQPNVQHIGQQLAAAVALAASMVDAPNESITAVKRKDWHAQVPRNHRNHIINKLVEAVPLKVPLGDRRRIRLVARARKVEGEMYGSALNTTQYYHLLAEQINTLKVELDEKRIQIIKGHNASSELEKRNKRIEGGLSSSYSYSPQTSEDFLGNMEDMGTGEGKSKFSDIFQCPIMLESEQLAVQNVNFDTSFLRKNTESLGTATPPLKSKRRKNRYWQEDPKTPTTLPLIPALLDTQNEEVDNFSVTVKAAAPVFYKDAQIDCTDGILSEKVLKKEVNVVEIGGQTPNKDPPIGLWAKTNMSVMTQPMTGATSWTAFDPGLPIQTHCNHRIPATFWSSEFIRPGIRDDEN